MFDIQNKRIQFFINTLGGLLVENDEYRWPKNLFLQKEPSDIWRTKYLLTSFFFLIISTFRALLRDVIKW